LKKKEEKRERERTQSLMTVSQATSDQKEKKEWDVASDKEAERLTSFLLLFS
jgi:hypothetical protein